MPADVVERPDLEVIPADDDQAFAGDLAEDRVARPRNLVLSADEDPHPGEEPLALFGEMAGVDVVARREGPGVVGEGVPGRHVHRATPIYSVRGGTIPIASTGQ